MEKPVIEIKNVKKQYRLGQIGSGTLTRDLQTWWAKVRKKEDPNAPINQNKRLEGDTFMALNGVSFSVNSGEAVGIIGTNGAGKSTLLKLITRITAPTAGEIVIRGKIASMLEVGTGFNPEMTGRENVYMNGAILGMTKAEIDSKMQQIIDFSEVGDFIDTPVKRYSSGMYVKLAFSVSAHLDSDIMIMDEVLAVGDAKFQKKCLNKMSTAAKSEGKTVLYVSHNMATIKQLCSRVIVLNEGKVIFDGSTEDGIEIYNEQITQKMSGKIDLENAKRLLPEYGEKAKLKFVEFTEDYSYVTNSAVPISFIAGIHSNIDCENLHLRAILSYFDSTRIGMAESCNLGTVQKDGDYCYHFNFDVSSLATGKYFFTLLLYEKHGTFGENYDHADVNYAFEIADNDDSAITWQSRYWGHFKMGLTLDSSTIMKGKH